MAAGSQHQVMITVTPAADVTPAAEDTTTGRVWLFDRFDRPAPSTHVVVSPAGGTVALGAGALVVEWYDEPVNLTHTLPSFVTAELWATSGNSALPLDHLSIDGRDGGYYVWELEYLQASTGRRWSSQGAGQLDALTDYQAAGVVGPDQGGGVFPVLSDALSVNTLQSNDMQSLVTAAVNDAIGSLTVGSLALAVAANTQAIADNTAADAAAEAARDAEDAAQDALQTANTAEAQAAAAAAAANAAALAAEKTARDAEDAAQDSAITAVTQSATDNATAVSDLTTRLKWQ